MNTRRHFLKRLLGIGAAAIVGPKVVEAALAAEPELIVGMDPAFGSDAAVFGFYPPAIGPIWHNHETGRLTTWDGYQWQEMFPTFGYTPERGYFKR